MMRNELCPVTSHGEDLYFTNDGMKNNVNITIETLPDDNNCVSSISTVIKLDNRTALRVMLKKFFFDNKKETDNVLKGKIGLDMDVIINAISVEQLAVIYDGVSKPTDENLISSFKKYIQDLVPHVSGIYNTRLVRKISILEDFIDQGDHELYDNIRLN